MPNTFLSAKKSDPVNWNPFRKPRRSKKNGSLRRPAKNLKSSFVVMVGEEPNDTTAPENRIWPMKSRPLPALLWPIGPRPSDPLRGRS